MKAPIAAILFLFFLSTIPGLRTAPNHLCISHVESLSYDSFARQACIQGDVVVQITVNEEGTVAQEMLISGHPLLAKEVEKNVILWRFRQGMAETIRVTYEFRLEEPATYKEPISIMTFDLPYKVRVTSKRFPHDHHSQ